MCQRSMFMQHTPNTPFFKLGTRPQAKATQEVLNAVTTW